MLYSWSCLTQWDFRVRTNSVGWRLLSWKSRRDETTYRTSNRKNRIPKLAKRIANRKKWFRTRSAQPKVRTTKPKKIELTFRRWCRLNTQMFRMCRQGPIILSRKPASSSAWKFFCKKYFEKTVVILWLALHCRFYAWAASFGMISPVCCS